jgi:hypothetical protein
MTRLALMLAVAGMAAGPALADPPKIDRTIAREPAYKTKSPRYGLLVFGPQARDHVWLVLDGDLLYVDRNGNGDLTEAGKKIAVEKVPGHESESDWFNFDVGDVSVGGRTHKALRVGFIRLKLYGGKGRGERPDVKAALAKDPEALAAGLEIDVDVPGLKGGGLGGRLSYSVTQADLTGVFQFADKPADPPVVWLGGPLQVTFNGELPSLRVGRDSDLMLVVGTQGIGPGTFAMLAYEGSVPADVKPVAHVVLAPAKPGDPPLKEQWVIKGRC